VEVQDQVQEVQKRKMLRWLPEQPWVEGKKVKVQPAWAWPHRYQTTQPWEGGDPLTHPQRLIPHLHYTVGCLLEYKTNSYLRFCQTAKNHYSEWI
jgi:hypothetical protein